NVALPQGVIMSSSVKWFRNLLGARRAFVGKPGRRQGHRPGLEPLEGRTLLSSSSLVFPGDDGHLVYVPDAPGNTIPDFSGVGYLGGTVPLPDTPGGAHVPTRVTLHPEAGDATARIQAALDQVAALPLDANGFRGAVHLTAGTYDISDHIEIRASGVVLRG